MLLDRETRLERHPSPLWRVVYPAACLLAVVLVAGAAGVRPAEAQLEQAPLDAEEVVVETVEADEVVPKPPAPTDLDLIEVEPIAEEGVEDAEQVEILLTDGSEPEVSRLAKDRNALRAERDQVRAQLKALEASVNNLREMVEALGAQRAMSQPAGRQSSRTPGPVPRRPEWELPKPVDARAKPVTFPPLIPSGHQEFQVQLDAATPMRLLPNDRVDLIPPSGYDGEPLPQDVPYIGHAHSPDYKEQFAILLVTTHQAKILTRAAAQGKISLRVRKASPPAMTPSEPSPNPPPSSLPIASPRASKTTSAGPRADPFAAIAERRAPEGTRLDLVRLATSLADAVAEAEIAKLDLDHRKESADRNAVPLRELAVAEIKFKAAQRKVDLLRNIGEAALMETRADMDAAKSQLESVAKGQPVDRAAVLAAEAQVIRTQSRLRVLESILESGGR